MTEIHIPRQEPGAVDRTGKPTLIYLAERLERSVGVINHKALGMAIKSALGISGSFSRKLFSGKWVQVDVSKLSPTEFMPDTADLIKLAGAKAEFHDLPHGYGKVVLGDITVSTFAPSGNLAVIAALCRAVHAVNEQKAGAA